MTTPASGPPLTAEQAKANARAILEIHGYRIRQDGRVVSVDALDADSVPNFYYSTALFTIAADYQGIADGALRNLLSCPGLLPAELAAMMQRLADASTQEAYDVMRAGMADRLTLLVPDVDLRQLVGRIVAHLDDSWSFTRASRRVAVGLAARAVEAFGQLTAGGRTTFGELRPVLQMMMMGRPQPSQIDDAIDAVEAAESQLGELIETFTEHCKAVLVPADRVVDPREPLDSTANLPRMRVLAKQLNAALPLDRDHVDPVLDAIEQAAGIVMTVMTGIRQLDERLSALGVTSA
jgi:hypothetical protein